MTYERQAVKTLAENLVKAMKTVNNTSSQVINVGTTPGTISASKIVGLPAAFSSIISGIESAAADGDAVALQTLEALNHIAAGEFETITADTAMISKIYATFGDFINLVAEDATIGDLDVETLRANLADIGLLHIGSANIDMAQIKRSSTQTAFIHESVQGQVYIDDLAVSDANIVNLAAGTILINDNSGNLVELYVDSDTGDVSTRPVSYAGTDIIDANSLHGNRIIQNSITTDRLNASEIFAYQSVIMNMIADNIEAARLFANQGFINQLQTAIISADLSQNSAFISLADSISLVASNATRTFLQNHMPIPVNDNDTWLDPLTEEHYVANISIPVPQMVFGHDDNGNLSNEHANEYQLQINSNGELMVHFIDSKAAKVVSDNNVDFRIVDNYVYADGLWKIVENVAFSRLKVSVDGITSEVTQIQRDVSKNTENITTNTSKIDQNSNQISAVVSRVEVNEESISDHESRITQNANSIASIVSRVETNEGNINSHESRITQNANNITSVVTRVSSAESTITNHSTSIEQNADAITLVSSNVGNIANGITAVPHVKTSSVEIQDNSVEIKSTGNVDIKASNFSISFNTSGSATNKSRVDISNSNGIKISDAYGNYFQATSGKIGLYDINNNAKLYMNNNGDAVFSGSIIGSKLTLGGSNNTNGSMLVNNSSNKKVVEINNAGISVWNGATKEFYVDSNGNTVFAGTLNAAGGTFTGTLSAACINSGSMVGDRISGGTLTLGGSNSDDNKNGKLVIKNASNATIGEWNKNGITVWNKTGTTKQFYIDSSTGKAVFAGNLSAAGGTFAGTLSAASITSGMLTDKTSTNTWNLDTGVFNTQSGKIGDFTLSGGTLSYTDSTATAQPSVVLSADGLETSAYDSMITTSRLSTKISQGAIGFSANGTTWATLDLNVNNSPGFRIRVGGRSVLSASFSSSTYHNGAVFNGIAYYAQYDAEGNDITEAYLSSNYLRVIERTPTTTTNGTLNLNISSPEKESGDKYVVISVWCVQVYDGESGTWSNANYICTPYRSNDTWRARVTDASSGNIVPSTQLRVKIAYVPLEAFKTNLT